MTKHTLDQAFIDAQRDKLLALKAELVGTADNAAREEQAAQVEPDGEPRDSADGAETMAIQENDEALFNLNALRVQAVQHALDKIEQGTYGLSDVSGEPIPRARLEAVPEAANTVEEQAASE
jgi:DnaK suppressor protein